MKYHTRRGLVIIGFALIIAHGITGCTKMIQPDQLNELKQLRAREYQLTQSISDAQSRKQRLEREIAARQDEVRRCNEQKTLLQSRLNAHPGNLGEPLPEAPPIPSPMRKSIGSPVQKKGRQ